LIKSILTEKGNKVVYRSSGEEVKAKLIDLGLLNYRLLSVFEGSSSEHYKTISRLFEEQFEVCEEKTVILKPKESISADSIQSPHDADCSYRNKDDNQVKGYSVNLTESCDKTGLNLISGVAVKTADAADNGYPEQSVVQAGEIFCDSVKNIHTDGAYHSESNQEFVLDLEAQIWLRIG
jgi:hypothetical protein